MSAQYLFIYLFSLTSLFSLRLLETGLENPFLSTCYATRGAREVGDNTRNSNALAIPCYYSGP